METKLFDIVRLANRHEFIVTAINNRRPVNPFVGVKVNGGGTEYRFGPKHRPVVIGHADATHPALVARNQKKGNPVSAVKGIIEQLLTAVEEGDLVKANILAGAIRTTSEFRK